MESYRSVLHVKHNSIDLQEQVNNKKTQHFLRFAQVFLRKG
jgi:hypothetical protein